MNNFILALIFFILLVITLVIANYALKQVDFKDSENEKECNDKHQNANLKQDDVCGVWDGVQCRKGTVKDGKCVSDNHFFAMLSIFMAISITFVGFMFFIIRGFINL